MGAVTPLGNSVDAMWAALLEGRCAIAIARQFETRDFPFPLAAEVQGFDPLDHMERKAARRMARFAQFAVAAAGEALRDAALNLARSDRSRVAVNIGTSLGGAAVTEAETLAFEQRGRRRLGNGLYLPIYIANTAACQVAMAYQLHGPTVTPVAACATGAYAVGDAARMIARGDADLALAGGSDAAVTALNTMAFGVIGSIADSSDPQRAVRPFDARRTGTVGGEGCGVLLLESLDHALARDARIYAEVAGFAATEDAYHITAPEPDATFAALAISRAIDDAELQPGDIDHISAHGTGTPLNDVTETRAIKRALGAHAHQVPISAIKSMLGHTAGAAGALALIGCVKSITSGWLPPTINHDEPDPACDLDYVPRQARRAQVDVALANAFGFGGQNAVVVLRRYQS